MRFGIWVCAIWAVSLLGQTDLGTIRGTITDSSGAPVPGAHLMATNVATSVEFPAVSTNSGVYTIGQLPPGRYTVTVEKSGFRKLVQENVGVEVADTTGLDLALTVGSVSETLTVQSQAPTIQTETSNLATVVSSKGFNDLPINAAGGGRSAETILTLTPGFTGSTFDAHINGSQTLTKEIQVDGLSTVISEIQGDPRLITFPPDSVQELSVTTADYPAEFGTSGGGIERFEIKSGTNQYHGDAFEFLRNKAFDARGFFPASVPAHHENEYGFTVGGPVFIPKVYNGKNRTFFFAAVDWYTLNGAAASSVASVPDDAARGGNLSSLGINIYDPNTTRTDPSTGLLVRSQFPGNVIPQSRISSISNNILGYIPHAQIQQAFNNFTAPFGTVVRNYNTTFRGDEYFSERQRLSLTYNYSNDDNNGSIPAQVLPHPVSSLRTNYQWEHIARARWDWTVTPSILNEFRLGYNRQHQLELAPELATNYSQAVGLTGVAYPFGFPEISAWGGFAPIAQNQNEIQPVSNTYLLSDSLSWSRGKHNLKFGGEIRRLIHNDASPSFPANYGFAAGETAFPSGALLNTTGSGYASFLLGLVDTGTETVKTQLPSARMWQFGFYGQDDYKVTPRLSLNLGLRWDIYRPMTLAHDAMSIMDPSAPNPAAGNLPGAYVFAGPGNPPHTGTDRLTSMRNTYLGAFGPRIGLAYKVTDRLVVRSAYGISYNPQGGLGGGNIYGPNDGYSATPLFQSPDGSLTPAFNWNNGFPQNFFHPPVVTAGLNVGNSANMWGDKAYIPSQKQDWNFGTQYQLAGNMLAEVSYVGSKSTHLNTGAFNINQTPSSDLSLGSLLTDNITNPAVVAAGFKPPYPGFTGTLAQALRPFPQYLTINQEASSNVGNMTYHALQVKVEKQFSKGLFLLSSYTYSKDITDANSSLGSFFSPSARDQYNRSLEKGLAVFDSPHRFTTAFNYELPIGTGKPFLNGSGFASKYLASGWQINGILSYYSGVPIQVSVNNNLPLFSGVNTPNSVLGQNPRTNVSLSGFDPANDKYLNAAAFTAPAPGQIGTSAQVLPNAKNPFVLNEDLGILKRTPITERVNLELRFELFNAFNRVVFGGIDGNISDPGFGTISSQANSARNGQIAAKINF